MTGIWPAHTNVEKYIMGLRDKFPVEVRTYVRVCLFVNVTVNIVEVDIRISS